MALGFIQDAISLSGLTGSKLKCDVIGEYYPFWWNITSGGPSANYEYATAIVELDAATGEVYIKDTQEVILGSAGHALNLKCTNPNTKKLKVILVEKDAVCYGHLKNVIRKRWNGVDISMAEGPLQQNSSGVYLMNKNLENALTEIEKIKIGNTLFLFDPLRSVEFQAIEKVASKRINTYYKTGTEFMVFVFTSDWFLGRDDFSALPSSINRDSWSPEEKKTVLEADALFGNDSWHSPILNGTPIQQRSQSLIELYKRRLHKWFRYVLPLPFNPKINQIFHLILCSNFITGVRATRNFYSDKTGNPRYSPNNKEAFEKFRKLHPEIFTGLVGVRRPVQWRILWKTIVEHEEGLCDCMCGDFKDVDSNPDRRQQLLEWLERNGYLDGFDIENAWGLPIPQYKLNWAVVKDRLAITPPLPLQPVSPKEIT
jgi:three-Cys-motif partner protein